MFYGVVQENYLMEVDFSKSLENIKSAFRTIINAIIKKAEAALQKLKGAKSAVADGFKKLIETCKGLDKELSEINDKDEAEEFAPKVDSAKDLLEKNYERMQEINKKQEEINDKTDKALGSMNAKAQELKASVDAANAKAIKGKK